jgi:hypothetical protein
LSRKRLLHEKGAELEMNRRSTRAANGVLPAIGLFFLAPLVAEFLLGNLPIKLLPALILLAPVYGGGALLIRELVRRTRRGWPSIFILALAYGILEEAFTTQSLFNPNYLKLNLHLLEHGYIPALGIGAWWTVFVLALHTVWSISTPIALVEASGPDRADTPWLGRTGLGATALLFAVGITAGTWTGFRQDQFVASAGQFAAGATVMVLLVFCAFLVKWPGPGADSGFTPGPWTVGALGLTAGSAILLMPPGWGWWAAGSILLLEGGGGALVLFWARRAGWTLQHKLALAGGAALAYGWHAFIQKPAVGTGGLSARVGNAIFAAGAVALILFAARRTDSWSRSQAKPIEPGAPADELGV